MGRSPLGNKRTRIIKTGQQFCLVLESGDTVIKALVRVLKREGNGCVRVKVTRGHGKGLVLSVFGYQLYHRELALTA